MDSNNKSYTNINEVGSVKDCGEFTGAAEYIVDFINEFPIKVIFAFYVSYMVVVIGHMIGDVGLRTCATFQKLSKESQFYKDSSFVITAILQVYKTASVGVLYPIISIKYDSCINIRWEFFINPGFYYLCFASGFLLSNGLLALFTCFIIKKKCCRNLFAIILTILSGLSAAVFTCGGWFIHLIKEKHYLNAFCCFPCGLISLVFSMYVFLYLLFSLIGVPIVTSEKYNYIFSGILIVRVIVMGFLDIKKK